MHIWLGKLLLAAVVLGGTAAAGATAEAAAYSFISAPVAFDTQLSPGFTFTANTSFKITSLGYYDYQGNGFLTPHDVGIYQGDGASGPGPLLVSTTLAASTSGTLGPNDFRYQAIAPLTLTAGQTYTIAGLSPNTTGNDAWVYRRSVGGHRVQRGSRITIPLDAARFSYFPPGGVLADPDMHFSDYQFYAVNIDGPTSAPEPASLTLLGVALAGLGLMSRRKRRTVLVAPAKPRHCPKR